MSDYISAKKLQELLVSAEIIRSSADFIKGLPQKFKNYGFCETPRMSNGTVVIVLTPYFARPCHEKKTKRRGKGYYPGLILLGVLDHCMPRLASDVSMLTAALASLQEAQNMLVVRGCKLDIKTIRNIMKRYAARARSFQESGDFPQDTMLDVTSRRVAISMDGGRIRIRSNKSGPRTKKWRKRFHTDWREPKLFIIYLLDDEGEMERKFCPIIDASLHGPDSIFALLEFYLSKMNIGKAASISFIADGAPWIWERVCTLLSKFGIFFKFPGESTVN